MKYILLPKPTEQEYYRIYETMFYFLVEEVQKTTGDVEQHLHALAMMSNTSSSQILLAASKLTEPLIKPTKLDIAITASYIGIPVRDISKKYMHHTTYYKHVYNYFDIESKEPRIKNRLDTSTTQEVIKLINYIRNTFKIYDIARKRITYDTEQ